MGTLIRIFIFSSLFLGCGSRLSTSYGEPRVDVQEQGGLSGALALTDGATVELSSVNQPIVLTFVTYLCISCREEAKSLAAYFQERGLPRNIQIYTVLAGSGLEKAATWARKYGVTWKMAADPDGVLFERYCPEKLTPCVLTQKAKQVLSHYGLTPIEQLEKETGPWIYQ